MPQIYLFLIILNNINGVTNVIFLKSKKKNGMENGTIMSKKRKSCNLKEKCWNKKNPSSFEKGFAIIAKVSLSHFNFYINS